MVMFTGDQGFGGKNQKDHTDCQKENKYFPGKARFHWL